MIQQNINQALSLASLLATQNPTIQAKSKQRFRLKEIERELGGIEKQEDILAEDYNKQLGKLSKDDDAGREEATTAYEEASRNLELGEKRSNLEQERFSLNPTQENLDPIMERAEEYAWQKARAKAEKAVKEKQEEIRLARDPNTGKIPGHPEAGVIVYRR
jgi:type II secretory pathway component PulK